MAWAKNTGPLIEAQFAIANHCDDDTEQVGALFVQIVKRALDVGLKYTPPAGAPQNSVGVPRQNRGIGQGVDRRSVKQHEVVSLAPLHQAWQMAIDEEHRWVAANGARSDDVEPRDAGSNDCLF